MRIIIRLKEELELSKQIFERQYEFIEGASIFDYLVSYAFECLCFHPDTDAAGYLNGMSHIPQLHYSPLTQMGVLDEDMMELEELFLQIYADLAEKIVYLFPTRAQRQEAGLLKIKRIDARNTFVLE